MQGWSGAGLLQCESLVSPAGEVRSSERRRTKERARWEHEKGEDNREITTKKKRHDMNARSGCLIFCFCKWGFIYSTK